MKILVITGSLYNNQGGPFLSVRSLVNALLVEGHHVTVLGSKDENKQSLFPESYKALNKKFQALKVYALNKFGPYHFHFTPKLKKKLSSESDYDVALIQAVWQWNCWRVFWFAYRRKITTIMSVRGEFNDNDSITSLKKRLFMPWIKFMFNRVNAIHVLNDRERLVLKGMGIKTPIEVIPNGVYMPEKVVKITSEKNNTMLFLGRLHPMKNIIPLIEAWKTANTHNWKLVIAGGGTDDFEIELKKMIGGDTSISLIGPVNEEQKPNVFSSASWFILPSLTEGMPMAALEAMSFGIPCLLSEYCNLSEFFDRKAALQSGTKVKELVFAIEKAMLSTDNERKIIVENALQLIQEKYSWNLVAKAFESIVRRYSHYSN